MTNPTRLFIASGIFHPEAGGPAIYLYELLPELQKMGWDVRALTYGAGAVDSTRRQWTWNDPGWSIHL